MYAARRGCPCILTVLPSLQRLSRACSIPASTCQAFCECSPGLSCCPQIPHTLVDVQCSRLSYQACASVAMCMSRLESGHHNWNIECRRVAGEDVIDARARARAGTVRSGRPAVDCTPTTYTSLTSTHSQWLGSRTGETALSVTMRCDAELTIRSFGRFGQVPDRVRGQPAR